VSCRESLPVVAGNNVAARCIAIADEDIFSAEISIAGDGVDTVPSPDRVKPM